MIKKIITGYVVQRFDERKGEFVSQEFIAGDQVSYEDEEGRTVETMGQMEKEYQPMLMVQPGHESTPRRPYDQLPDSTSLWDYKDVLHKAPWLSDYQAREVIEHLGLEHDPDCGITWDFVEDAIKKLFPREEDRT